MIGIHLISLTSFSKFNIFLEKKLFLFFVKIHYKNYKYGGPSSVFGHPLSIVISYPNSFHSLEEN